MSSMTDIEAGRAIEKIEALTVAVNQLTKRIADLESQVSYGKGVLWGLLTFIGAVGTLVGWVTAKVSH